MENSLLGYVVWFYAIALLWGADEDLGEGSKSFVLANDTWLIDFTYWDFFFSFSDGVCLGHPVQELCVFALLGTVLTQGLQK